MAFALTTQSGDGLQATGVRATSLNDMMDPVSGRLLTQLPERVIMALTAAPTMFAVPTCINKGFNPPFVVSPTLIVLSVSASVSVLLLLGK